MISYVLGAPGAGKSAAVLPLRALLTARAVLDWDAFMVPAGLLAGANIRLQARNDPAQTHSALDDANSYRSIGLPTLERTGLAPAKVAWVLADWIMQADGKPLGTS